MAAQIESVSGFLCPTTQTFFFSFILISDLFLEEVLGEHAEVELDEETLATINHLFDNNLNISETARQLFIHRNTLVYRLKRIEKKLGLDIRTFEDAMLFKIAMMVRTRRNTIAQEAQSIVAK